MMWAFFIVLLTLITIIALPLVSMTAFMLVWATAHRYMSPVFILTVIMVFIYLWSMLITKHRYQRWLKKKMQLLLILPIALGGCILGGTFAYDAWQSRFEVMRSEVDLFEYEPFHSDKLAILDKKSSYSMQEPLLRLDGATALYPVYASFVQAVYPEEGYADYSADTVRCTTTPFAYESLMNGDTDLIFAAAPSDKQKEMFEKEEKELVMVPLGMEAFVFFVNSENPVESLTTKQIQDIYSGNITNWKDVGGNNERIRAFQRPEGSGSQSALLRFMEGKKLMSPPQKDVASGMGDIVTETAEYENRENAIGYSFRYYTQGMVKNKGIRLLKVDGIEPSVENIRMDTYPISSPFYAIYVKGNTNKNLQPFLNWIQSKEGKELIEKTGYVAGS